MEDKNIEYIRVEDIYPHPNNPRKCLGDLTELAESIRAQGILQNLTVVQGEEIGKYTAIIGHRRLAAAKLAGLQRVPCIIAELSEREQLAMMLLENVQRSDLNVYEQAKGFQLMMELGESVESLSQKTGFSESTVRRRLKMAELDEKKLQDVATSGRQLSLGDFDKLAQIEDVKARNAILDKIGTNNFEYSLQSALKEQKRKKAKPFLMATLKAFGAREMNSGDRWSGKYDKIHDFTWIDLNEPTTIKIPKKYASETQFFYALFDTSCEIWIKAKKKKAKKASSAEIERKKYVEDVREKLSALARQAYELRYNFITSQKYTKANAGAVLEGAIIAILEQIGPRYKNSPSAEYWAETLEADKKEFEAYTTKQDNIYAAYKKQLVAHRGAPQIAIIYAAFGDGPREIFHEHYTSDFPRYRKNECLEYLYKWLCLMGYEMSDEEKQLLDGSHPLFIDKDA